MDTIPRHRSPFPGGAQLRAGSPSVSHLGLYTRKRRVWPSFCSSDKNRCWHYAPNGSSHPADIAQKARLMVLSFFGSLEGFRVAPKDLMQGTHRSVGCSRCHTRFTDIFLRLGWIACEIKKKEVWEMQGGLKFPFISLMIAKQRGRSTMDRRMLNMTRHRFRVRKHVQLNSIERSILRRNIPSGAAPPHGR